MAILDTQCCFRIMQVSVLTNSLIIIFVLSWGFIGAAAEIGVLRVCIQEGYVDCQIVDRVLK